MGTKLLPNMLLIPPIPVLHNQQIEQFMMRGGDFALLADELSGCRRRRRRHCSGGGDHDRSVSSGQGIRFAPVPTKRWCVMAD